MENREMVVDTSIFIEFLRAKDKTNTNLYKIAENQSFYISAITSYELYMGATSKSKKEDVNKLITGIPILSFNDDIAQISAEIYHNLRRKNKMIEFRDIFIAATCLHHELPILTLNRNHFNMVDNLLLSNIK